ncbi:hypothetical protein BDP27DRAFT_338838 [Rhodocollybia butyracea]|uniref:Uncharacterized protein n=1 Tax=Rhodocollybia butyracea TaxID=206335 RepID=A0A9P5QB38_9AGAR|nr:hypothetical protein BDP27DRAFT_338838 [Rhodocollybia butyracea]
MPISPLSPDIFSAPCSSWSSSPAKSGGMPDQSVGGMTTSVCCPCIFKARQRQARLEQTAFLKQQRIQQKIERMQRECKASDRPQRYEENQDLEYNHDEGDKEFEMGKKRRSNVKVRRRAQRAPIAPLPPPPPTSPPLAPLPPPPPITIDPALSTTPDNKARSQKRISSSSMSISSTGLESSTSLTHPPSILRTSTNAKRTSLTSFSGLSGLSFGGAKPNGPAVERRLTGGSQISQISHLTDSSNLTQSTSSTSAFASSSIYTTSRSSSMMHSMSSRQFEDLVAGHMDEAGQAPPSYEHVVEILRTKVVMADRV